MLRGVLARRRAALAPGAVVVAIIAIVAAAAVVYPGYTAQRLTLEDGSVWVVNRAAQAVGRANPEVLELNAVVPTQAPTGSIVQGEGEVLLVDPANATLDIIDPVSASISERIPLPPDRAEVALVGDRAVIHATGTGELWIVPLAELDAFDPANPPALSLGEGSAVSTDLEGGVLALAPALGELYRLDVAHGGGIAASWSVPVDPDAARLQLSSVSGRWAVLDPAAGRLILEAGIVSLSAAGVDGARIQQPSAGGDAVLVATGSGLLAVPLDAGPPRTLTDTGAGSAAAPLVADGCVFAAWTSGTAWRDCGEGGVSMALAEMPGAAQLVLTRGSGDVVLNDEAGGASWAVADSGQLIDNWAELIPPDEEREQVFDEETPLEIDPVQKPPVAVADEFGARPGRSTVLPVLLNDYDSNGDVLVISDVEPIDEAIGRVDLVTRNQQLQLTLASDARGVVRLGYTITDGRGGSAAATVEVDIKQDSENSAPRQLRFSSLLVAEGGRLSTNALGDWVDPEGDPVYLAAASAEGGAVSAKPDGAVVFTDTGESTGRTAIALTVSDGRAEATGALPVEIRPRDRVPITLEPWVALAAAGEQITLRPLTQARAGGIAVRLGAVPEKPGVTIAPDFENGTFVFSSERIGTHYLTVTVTDGDRTGTGAVRIEVIAPSETGTRPVTVPQTLFVTSLDSASVDPTLTDIDPAGGVLVVTGVEDAPSGTGLKAEILDQREIRVTLLAPLDDGPASVRYRISNGVADAEGVITVVEIPQPARVQPPLATDDRVTVRVGDVVDIPVLANDEQPDGQTLSLETELVEGLPAGGGLIFASGDLLRYLAPETAGDYSVVYSARGEDGQTAQATVRLEVREVDAESNRPPLPRTVTARVIAGESVQIEVPLASIDPDGDAVQLIGAASSPEKGTVVSDANGVIRYQAGDYSSGTDSFRYTVVDGLGARAEGIVRVGISPRLEGARNPVANEDVVAIRPGRTVSVQVLANDSDPDGSPLRVVSATPSQEDGTRVEVVDGELVRVTPPQAQGRYSAVYLIENEYGGQSSAFISVTVDPDAPLSPPVARDTVLRVSDVLGKSTVEVDVLDSVFFADGDVAELELGIEPGYGSGAIVTEDRRILVEIGGASQIIPFSLAHPEDPRLRGYAFVWVPGYDDALPQLDPAAPPLQVVSEETLVIELNDRIVALGGQAVRLVDAGAVSATHSDGTSLVVDEDTLRFTSADRYFGPAAITLEVTDGASASDPEGRRAVLTLPITVTPRENQPPVFVGAVVDFEPGQAKELDLIRLTNYPYDDLDELVYTLLDPLPEGFEVELNGQRAVITAGLATPAGTSQVARFGVADAINEGQPGLIRLGVVPSTRPLAQLAADSAVARRGETTTIDVLANDGSGNPFPGSPLSVVAIRGLDGASLPPGVSITPDDSRSRLKVTVSQDAEPIDTTLQYQVADATNDPARYVWGTVTISVQDVPSPVANVTVTEFGDRSLELSWTPGAANNSPIDHYEVTMTSVAGGETISTTNCASTVGCSLATEGNGPNHAVRLAVAAVNEIGRSTPVQNSEGSIWSDVVPPAPTGLDWAPLDQGLTVSWVKPETSGAGSPIDRYVVTVAGSSRTLAVDPAAPAGTPYSLSIAGIAGADNGSSVSFSVSARNSAPADLAAWNRASGTGVPAWTPLVVGSPSASGTSSPSGTTVAVNWDGVFSANGRAITEYSVRIDTGEVGGCETATPVGTATSHEFSGLVPDRSYTVAVFADNGLGGCSAAATAGVTTRATPGTVRDAGFAGPAANGAGRWDFRITDIDSGTASGDHLRYRLAGDGVDGSASGVVELGSFLTTGNQSHYGVELSVELQACAVWPEVTLCSAEWSAPFPLGVAIANSPPPGLTAAITETTEDPIEVTGLWTWNGPPPGDYDRVEYDCGEGRERLGAGPGQCEATGSVQPAALEVVITENGVEYPRSYQWADFD